MRIRMTRIILQNIKDQMEAIRNRIKEVRYQAAPYVVIILFCAMSTAEANYLVNKNAQKKIEEKEAEQYAYEQSLRRDKGIMRVTGLEQDYTPHTIESRHKKTPDGYKLHQKMTLVNVDNTDDTATIQDYPIHGVSQGDTLEIVFVYNPDGECIDTNITNLSNVIARQANQR